MYSKTEKIQKKLFRLGFNWCGGSTAVQCTNQPFLIIKEIGIQWSNDMGGFAKHTNKEVTADYILDLTWKEEEPEFQPFDKVLGRDENDEMWRPALYCDICDVYGQECWKQIISYEGNEHLAYTNNNPK